MPLRKIQVAKTPNNAAPTVRSKRYANGQTFKPGAALALTGGELTEAVSPIVGATLVGIAAEGVASHPGYNLANDDQVKARTGVDQAVSYHPLEPNVEYSAALVNNSNVPIAPVQADIGQQYGLKAYNGEWVVDKSQVAANACVTITDIEPDLGCVLFKPMAARLAGL